MIGQVQASPPLRLTGAAPSDTAAVLGMVGRCSRNSLFHRFHGPSDGVAYTKAQLDRPGDIVHLAWEGGQCVGMAVLGRDLEGSSHLGVLVEDDRQRRGVGSRLVASVLREATSRGVHRIHADVMEEDHHLVAALRRAGTSRVDLEMGSYSMDIELPARQPPPGR